MRPTASFYPRKTKLMMMLRNGWQKIISTMKTAQIKQQKNMLHSLGPHSSLPNMKGFQENLIRPTGGGKKGFVLGSVRALPTGKMMALSLGQICTL